MLYIVVDHVHLGVLTVRFVLLTKAIRELVVIAMQEALVSHPVFFT